MMMNFASLSEARRLRMQLQERDTQTLMSMENRLDAESPNSPVLVIVRELLAARGVVPNNITVTE